MPRHSTRLKATTANHRWLTLLGITSILCAVAPTQAQGDAKKTLVEQGNYWQSMGRNDLAEEAWRKVLGVDPQSADAMYGMSQVELARKKPDQASGWMNRLRAAHPDDPRARALPQQASGTTQTDLQRARSAAKAGRTAEAIRLYRTIFGKQPPSEPLAIEFYQVLGGTQQGWEEGHKGLEQLVKDSPNNLAYKLALAQLKTYRTTTRREGIRSLTALSTQPGVGAAATASWRQALIWLDAREADAPLYTEFLSTHPDPAVQARLDGLSATRTVATPVSPAARPLEKGFKALDSGDSASAEQHLQQALKAKPGDADALGGLGLIRLRQERFAQAQQYLEQATKAGGGGKWASALQSASYWNLVDQANAARTSEDTQRAQSLLERAIKIDPRESVGQVALADLRLAANDYAGAEQGYRRALNSKPNDTQALRGLIATYTRQGRSDEALALSQRLTPEQARQVGSLQDVQVEAARAKARTQTETGDTAGAQRTLEDAMLAVPDSPWIRLDLANIYRRQGLMAQSRGVMDGLLMSESDTPDTLYASALLASDAGDPAAGLQYLDRIPTASRTREMTQLQRRLWAAGQVQQAQALARRGDVESARGVLAQTEAALGTNMPPEIWGQLAGAYADIGDAPRALAMSRQLLTRGPKPSVGDRLLYASVLLKTDQDIELSAVLRQLQSAPMSSDQRADFERLSIAASLRQTDALREAGNLEAAYNAMAPVVAARPDDPQALAALARLYAAAGDETQALALYQRTLQRNPTDLDTLLAAAASASALQAHGEAENYVQRALKQAPEQSKVLAVAGRVYRNGGDYARAEQYLAAAVAADNQVAGGVRRSANPGAIPSVSTNPFAGMTGGGASMHPVGRPVVNAPPSYFLSPTTPAAAPAAYPANAQLPGVSTPWSLSGRTAATAAKSTPTAPRNAPVGAQTGRSTDAGRQQPMLNSRAIEGNWNAPPKVGVAPVNPLLSELQELQAERSTTFEIGNVYRSRDGEAGLSKLQDLQVPIEARIPVGNGKVVLSATPTVLDNDTLAPDFGTSSRFGGGPQAALNQLTGAVPAVDGQHTSGVGLAVGYEGKNVNASIGTTPLGFQQSNVIGNLSYSGAITDTLSMKAEVSRRAITDSLLSFAGTEDPRTGERWGGAVATGARLDVTHDDGTYGIYGYGSGHSITGHNVADNSRYELGGGMYVHLLNQPGSKLTAGINVDLLSYQDNLSYFTYGHGGYFSPQSYVSVAFPIDWTGRNDRLSWRLNASLGVQSFKQDAAPWFPTDPARQAGATSAASNATELGLNKAAFTGHYASTSHTGFAYNLAGVVEYQLAPQLFFGGAMAFNNAQNYRQFTLSAYLRYRLGNNGRLGASTGGATLKPVSSPYTPLL